MAIPKGAPQKSTAGSTLKLFLCGDLMLGRAIDQILPCPCPPELHEPWIKNALDYLHLAERKNGPIPYPVAPAAIWGDLLDELARQHPDLRIVNLECAITRSSDYWAKKAIHYRLSPENSSCLKEAEIDCCVLANNHSLDWGRQGLLDTLSELKRLKITPVGAGATAQDASKPAIMPVAGKGRVLLFAVGLGDSGIAADWQAEDQRPGIQRLESLNEAAAKTLIEQVETYKKPGDTTLLSIHWGGNWGYRINEAQIAFAHRLIDSGALDLIYGHSAHHIKGIEVYRGKLILYGCGDFLDDYEGIAGYEHFCPDLGLAYLPELEAGSGQLHRLIMCPTVIRRLQVQRAQSNDARLLQQILQREGQTLGSQVCLLQDNRLQLTWH